MPTILSPHPSSEKRVSIAPVPSSLAPYVGAYTISREYDKEKMLFQNWSIRNVPIRLESIFPETRDLYYCHKKDFSEKALQTFSHEFFEVVGSARKNGA